MLGTSQRSLSLLSLHLKSSQFRGCMECKSHVHFLESNGVQFYRMDSRGLWCPRQLVRTLASHAGVYEIDRGDGPVTGWAVAKWQLQVADVWGHGVGVVWELLFQGQTRRVPGIQNPFN